MTARSNCRNNFSTLTYKRHSIYGFVAVVFFAKGFVGYSLFPNQLSDFLKLRCFIDIRGTVCV